MDVYDKSSPMNDILVRGEEARRRRSKKRRIQPDEEAVGSSVRLRRDHESISEHGHEPYVNCFKEMISYPCKKELSRLEKFTIFSAVTIYLPISLFLMLLPVQACLTNGRITHKQCTIAQGFYRISGVQVLTIGFLYVIFSRATGRVSSHNIILGTVLSRTLYAASALYLLYIRHYISVINFYFGLATDLSVSLATLGIWASQPGDKRYFQSIWELIRPSNVSIQKSSFVVQVLGYLQTILGLLSLVCPTAATHMLHFKSKELNSFTMGTVCLGFLSSAAVGFIHILSGGADSRSFNLATVFYRLIFTMPFIAFLGALREIPFGLALYYISIDGIFALAVFVTLLIESKKVKKL